MENTGLKITKPSSNSITQNEPTNNIHGITATTDTSAYDVITADGPINAILTEIISCSTTIKNSYVLEKIPPPRPRDPLEGYVRHGHNLF